MRKLTNEFIEELNINKTWLNLYGMFLCFIGLMIILGYFFNFSQLITINLCIVSIILFAYAFKFWFKKSNGFIIYIFESCLYLFFSLFFFKHFILRNYVPFLLVSAFFITGCFRIYIGFSQVFIYKRWIGTILSGVVTLILSIIGMYYYIGIILPLGLNAFFIGVSFVVLGFGSSRLPSSKSNV